MIIPFFIPHAGCPHQCVFCDQKRITGAPPLDITAIPRTIERYLAGDSAGTPEVAFYGGSFTAIPRGLQRSCLEAVRPFIASGRVSGIRISTRPDCIDPDTLHLLHRHTVTTVELGAQSLDDRVLALSGRGHTALQTFESFTLLRQGSFRIGLQLMPGLPGDSAETFERTLQHVIALKPDFVRIYPALVIRDTPLATLFRDGSYTPLSLDEAVELCRKALVMLEGSEIRVVRMGLQPTEELERPGTIIAGPYHPAFRQLVDSAVMLGWMREEMRKSPGRLGHVDIRVNPRDLSAAIGQKRSNLKALHQETGLTITILPDGSVPSGKIRLS